MAWDVEYADEFEKWWEELTEEEQIHINMTKAYKTLRDKMRPQARVAAAKKTQKLLAELPLQELRQARRLSQEQLATLLNVRQATVSKMEHRTDMYISTLRGFIKAMGGDLEIIAKFPDGEVSINQFEDVEAVHV